MNGKREFLNALRFMTIVPVPSSDAIAPDWLSRCARYFPVVGIGVGLVSAVVLLLADRIWGPVVGSLLAVAASIVVTGALHEDGLADTADGLGGGSSVEKRLAIMKDSRIGAFGTLALAFSLSLRVTALADMPSWTAAAALISAHAAARVTPAFVMNALPYAGDTAAMKVSYIDAPVSAHDRRFALIVVLCALLPLAFISILSVISGLLLGAALAAALTRGRASGSTAIPATFWARSSKCSRSASCSASPPSSDRAGWLLIESVLPAAYFTSPLVGEGARCRCLCGSISSCFRPFQRQRIRLAFARLGATADPVDRIDHAATALKQIIRQPHHQPVRRGGR